MFDDLFKSEGFGNFLSNTSNLGLKYLDAKYITPLDQNSSKKDEEAKKYEQIQQRAAPAPVKSPLDNKIIIYGAVGAVVLLTAVVALKAK
jgi:hypothetical protein